MCVSGGGGGGGGEEGRCGHGLPAERERIVINLYVSHAPSNLNYK